MFKQITEPREKDIARLFDRIAGKYDSLNHLLSSFIDTRWRKKAVKISLKPYTKTILDVSTGTGDLAICYHRKNNGLSIYGLDISMKMLQIARNKANNIFFINGSGLNLPFKENTFDLVSCAFGIRNIYPREQGISEFYRVLKPNGMLMILEFSMPDGLFGKIYRFYFNNIVPKLGNMISRTNAYSYLATSVQAFPATDTFTKMLITNGFKNVKVAELTFGIANIYTGNK